MVSKITIEISSEKIAHLFTSAIEGGDPVTTASRGGWCAGINWASPQPVPTGAWWADPANWESIPPLKIIEVDDETTGHTTTHRVNGIRVRDGLAKMASVFPHRFAQILSDEIDAPCADAFLQSMLFGEEKYA